MNRLLVLVLPCSLSVVSLNAQELYESGRFPAGTVYQADDLGSLADQPIPEHTYLIGDFMFLGSPNGVPTFCTYTIREGKFIPKNLVVRVRFFGGVPAGLVQGKALFCDAADPFTILSVKRVPNLSFLLVECESHSKPTTNKNTQ